LFVTPGHNELIWIAFTDNPAGVDDPAREAASHRRAVTGDGTGSAAFLVNLCRKNPDVQ